MVLKLDSDEVTIKRRGCADGNKQRDWLPKEYTSSPTVSNDIFMTLCMIDATEGWEVATNDILGAFLQTEFYKGDIHIKLEGDVVNLLEDIKPEYCKYFVYTDIHGRKYVYAEAKKAIYGTPEVSLIFWANVSKGLEEMVYQRNQYNCCVMNKIIDDKKCIMLWHVDGMKTSHVEPAFISSVLSKIDA